jgi:hypothetical protein
MAILKGFPPSNTISPSVRITEKDLSFVAPEQSSHRAGIVGFASKGPINIPTMIATRRQLNTVFGYPHPESGDPYLIYAAEQYLLVANELYIVRVADTNAVSSESASSAMVQVTSAGGQVELVSDTAGAYNFDRARYFKWKLNGVLASKTLVVLSNTDHPDPAVNNGGYSVDQLVEDLNSQLVPSVDGIVFYNSDPSGTPTLAVRTSFSFGPSASLELISVQDALYGPKTVTVGDNVNVAPTGLGQGMTVAQITAGVEGPWNFTQVTEHDLYVVVDGTDNSNIDNTVQVIDLSGLANNAAVTAADLAGEINDQIDGGFVPGGFEAVEVGNYISIITLTHGRDAKLLVKTDSSIYSLVGFDYIASIPSAPGTGSPNTVQNMTAVGTTPTGVTGDIAIMDDGLVYGSSNSTGEVSLTITADSPGIDGNSTQVVIKNNIREGNFIMEVYNNGVQIESWGNLTKDQSSRFYVETFLSLVSDFVKVMDNTDNPAPPLDGTYSLSGGSDGIPSDPDYQDALLIGSLLGMTGLYALSEPEQIDIDLLAVPGHSSSQVIQAMIDVCQNLRSDCMAIVDPPFGLTVKEIVQWQNGAHPLNPGVRFDSDFAALYWPWVKVRDTFNNVDVWIPPSGSIMAVYARNDFLAFPWFAPAGLTRGIVPNITDVFSRPTLEERDLMYGNRNAVNPIVQYIDSQDFVVWGQKTLQRRPTALDRVNVRRLMFYIEKRIRAASRVLLFDPHDEIFHQKFIRIAKSILEQVQIGRGLTDYIIKADFELNTPDVIDRNEFRARIGVQPTRAVEFMFIEFSIHRTGSFDTIAESF